MADYLAKKRSRKLRHGYSVAHSEKIQLKREIGLVSCAECRRLKLKCDKRIPCQSCDRRGLAHLCPTGCLKTSEGTRFVLAATEPLQHRIAKINLRILQLEHELNRLQSQYSTEIHPFLRDARQQEQIYKDQDRRALREDLEFNRVPSNSAPLVETFGTLSISHQGISRFFGPTGASESLLCAELEPDIFHDKYSSSELTQPLTGTVSGGQTLFSRTFPFPFHHYPEVQKIIESYLPSFDEADAICRTYLDEVMLQTPVLSKNQLMDEIFPTIYKRHNGFTAPPLVSLRVQATEETDSNHLALFFVVLAIGSQLHFHPSMDFAEHFYQLSYAAFRLKPILVHPSLMTVQTLSLMSTYTGLAQSDQSGADNYVGLEMAWSLRQMAIHLALTMGLHRDCFKWGFAPVAAERRGTVFWHIFSSQLWESFSNGRPPPFFSLSYIDCPFPRVAGETQYQVEYWRFAIEVLHKVISETYSLKMPSYDTIMRLDQTVRRFDVEDKLQVLSKSMKAYVLLYLHLSFFARTLIDHPNDPLKSPYAHSFLAAFRSSSSVLEMFRIRIKRSPITASRIWMSWSAAFSAATVFGTIVASGPRSSFAQFAMKEFENAYDLFEKLSKSNRRAAKALSILARLRIKVHNALDATGSQWNTNVDTQEELLVFTGRTRVFDHSKPSEQSQVPSSSMPPLLPNIECVSQPSGSSVFLLKPDRLPNQVYRGQNLDYSRKLQGVQYPAPTSATSSCISTSYLKNDQLAATWFPSTYSDVSFHYGNEAHPRSNWANFEPIEGTKGQSSTTLDTFPDLEAPFLPTNYIDSTFSNAMPYPSQAMSQQNLKEQRLNFDRLLFTEPVSMHKTQPIVHGSSWTCGQPPNVLVQATHVYQQRQQELSLYADLGLPEDQFSLGQQRETFIRFMDSEIPIYPLQDTDCIP